MTPNTPITQIIRKIFDDYDEKNGATVKVDYTDRAEKIVDTWTREMSAGGLTSGLICELHRLVCGDMYIPVNDANGGISGFAKAGEYRTMHSSAPSELHKGKRTLFMPPEQIPQSMEQLVATMNGVFAANPPKELAVENIVAFTVDTLTIHPFANQNGRIAQVLMELLAFQAGVEPFNVSYLLANHKNELMRSLEEIRIDKNISSFFILLNKVAI